MRNKTYLACLTILLLINSSCRQDFITDHKESSLVLNEELRQLISTETVTEQEVENRLVLNGKITFDEERVVEIVPIFGGNVTQVKVELGDYVEKGSELAVIKSGEVAEYEKQWKEAGQQVLVTSRNYKMAQDMFNSGMSSERDVMIAKQELISAEAELKRVKEVIQIHNISDNSEYIVKSPVSGFVVGKNINREMQIRSDKNDEIFTISGLEEIWVIANVYETDINKVYDGAPVEISTIAYPDQVYHGTIDKVYNILDENNRTMSVRIKLKNPGYQLKPGMFAGVSIFWKSEDKHLPTVSSGAIIFEDGKDHVVILNPDQTFSVRQVEIANRSGEKVFVSSGLTDGETVVVGNSLLLYNELK